MSIRTTVIRGLIELNENLIFYPKLKKFYKENIKSTHPIILDVGSNRGQSIDFFLSINKNSTIHGFEPNGSLYQKIKSKYANNKNITLSNVGVSNKKGSLVFNENLLDETSSFEALNYDSEYLHKKAKILGVATKEIVKDTYEVKVTTLNDYIQQHIKGDIDVIKIDVEGHEHQCLEGLFLGETAKNRVKLIQLESHHDDMYISHQNKDSITAILNKNGFKEVCRIKHGFGDFYEIIYGNTKIS